MISYEARKEPEPQVRCSETPKKTYTLHREPVNMSHHKIAPATHDVCSKIVSSQTKKQRRQRETKHDRISIKYKCSVLEP